MTYAINVRLRGPGDKLGSRFNVRIYDALRGKTYRKTFGREYSLGCTSEVELHVLTLMQMHDIKGRMTLVSSGETSWVGVIV